MTTTNRKRLGVQRLKFAARVCVGFGGGPQSCEAVSRGLASAISDCAGKTSTHTLTEFGITLKSDLHYVRTMAGPAVFGTSPLTCETLHGMRRGLFRVVPPSKRCRTHIPSLWLVSSIVYLGATNSKRLVLPS